MTTKECIDILNACRFTLQDKYGILSLRLFGSTARNEQNSDSDVDVFVETKTPNPFLLMEARDYLEESTGRSVDIVRNHRNLNPRLRERIERDGIIVF
ncbi:MAG: nucleotidyltransferase domain-containing protein [Prevotella sp.]|nr:nucleotidyltransferase domain-containing protein [Prevotella sp.]